MKVRGVYEKVPGSNVWWIRYADASGRIRREKVGPKSAAIQLYQTRKTEVRVRKKLPENFRSKSVLFAELAHDAIEWAKSHKISWQDDEIRLKPLQESFGSLPADSITPQDIERWFAAAGVSRNKDKKRNKKKWRPATFNRYKALISMVYRQGIKNHKVTSNPAREIERRKENNIRVRYLLHQEELALRDAISAKCPEHLPELDIALHTGMRRSEQYDCEWGWLNLDRRVLTVPRSKSGEHRHVFLNDTAIAAFQLLWRFSDGKGKVFAHLYRSDKTTGARGWFKQALSDAGVRNFRWHDLRHTFASRLVMAGVDIRTVQDLMGHMDIQVTLRYSHLAPQHELEAVQRLCNTGVARNEPTDTRTSTRDLAEAEPIVASRQ
ncbi:MAG: site-specific integrase [Acidobacteriia bacterium]|nr:site-specific integrase [Terriglobia bacterium]